MLCHVKVYGLSLLLIALIAKRPVLATIFYAMRLTVKPNCHWQNTINYYYGVNS